MPNLLEDKDVGAVLRRYDRAAHLPLRYASYDVNLLAKPFVIDGIRAATLFFPKGKEHAVSRATKLGWIDETRAWMIQVGLVDKDEVPSLDLDSMNWNEIRKFAASRGLDLTGKRSDIEQRIQAHHVATHNGVMD